MWGGARGAGQRDEYFRALDLNAPVAAFAPLGRIGRVRAKPGVSLAVLAWLAVLRTRLGISVVVTNF